MYSKHYNVRRTPQNQPIPGKNMVKNRAGGFGFAVSNWQQLERFLILGSEKGYYYADERTMTVDNAENVRACITEDGTRVVNAIREISVNGRAPKNTPAIFALAMCVAFGDNETRSLALNDMPRVCRIGTHLFHFMQDSKQLGVPSNKSFRKAIARWYNEKDPATVAYQVLKYQGRTLVQKQKDTRWTHKDVLRLAHVKPATDEYSQIFHWAIYGDMEEGTWPYAKSLHQIAAYERARYTSSESELISLIRNYRLTHEMIPSTWKKRPAVWEALLERMPLTATIRNLATMTKVGVLAPMSHGTNCVLRRLTNVEYLRKSRIHPLAVLVALRTYASGHGMRSDASWKPVQQIVDALDDAFYLTFGNVEPTNKNLMLSLDVSASMTWNYIAGMPITPREASAAMALITARTEPNHVITAFSDRMVDVRISPRMRLDDVIRHIEGLYASGTDCALPMKHALQNGLNIDAFVIYTDTETWYGDIHPTQALAIYRQKTGIPAKLISVAMETPDYDIVDPNDMGQLGVTGFDTATPAVISNFVKG